MKLSKVILLLITLILVVSCSKPAEEKPAINADENKNTPAEKDEKPAETGKTIDELKVVFVPSRDAKDIAEKTEPLKGLLISELAKSGYTVNKVDISTMTNYEAAGEALKSGSAHIGLLPGGTYAAYSGQGVKVVLASTRNGLKYDTEDPMSWNTGEANDNNSDIVTYYRGIIIAGPSEKGQQLINKVKNNEELTWEDVSTAKWCVQSVTSGSGYQYPAVWLHDRFGKSFSDFETIDSGGYSGAASKLALGQCDVAPGYNDFRMDNAEKWVNEWGMESIWTETQVIGVTDKIQNDTVSVSEALVDDQLADAVAEAFINLAKTPEGAEAIKIYNHRGYMRVTDADYEGAKKVNQLVQKMNQ